MADDTEVWDLWFPGPGASGLSFARARIDRKDAQGRILVHAAPQRLDVTVRDSSGTAIAQGTGLQRRMPGPMSVLVRNGSQISLEDGWPTAADVGQVVILPGGEAGILKQWWHAEDKKEWRWQVEFYNQIR
jgi:hypothetical protein